MSDWDERHEKPQRDPTEGVRIIGADEAAEAYERGDVRRRLSDGEPRFGDRPPSPAADGPRPALRFPLGSSDDPATFERPAPVPVQPRTEAPELSHWVGSAAEEVPHMNRRDPRKGDDGSWSSVTGPGPRWREDAPVEEPAHAQPANWPPPGSSRVPPGAPDYEGGSGPPPGRSVFGDAGGAPGAPPAYEDAYGDEAVYGDDEGYEGSYGETYADDEGYDGDYYGDEQGEPAYAGPHGGPATAAPPARSRRRARGRTPRQGGERDMRTAVLVGVAFAALALALFKFGGPVGAMVLVVPIIGYAAYEYFVGVHQAGLQPLLPVGVTASVGLVLAAYNYGEVAIPLGIVLTTAVCFLWYLVNAGGDRPAANIGVTLLGVVWIGVFGSFAALLLSVPVHGVAFLLAAVVPTIAYDVGGLFVGRSAGSRALSPASPNKTIEGLAGGMFLAVAAGVVFGAVGVTPIDSLGEGLKIGLVAALAAPIGDLSESLVKRDLDLKDMGSVLPGHGGLLDRFDAVLFVLPAIWYLAVVSDFFLR